MQTSIRNKNKKNSNSQGGFVRLVKNGVVTRVRKSCAQYIRQLIHSIKYSLHNTFVTKRTTPFSTTGFVILFAVLASTLILAMAVSIFNVAYKEQVLSISTKQSAYADAGADMGLECVMYNDIKKQVFPDPNFLTTAGTGATNWSAGINCADVVHTVTQGLNQYQFSIEIDTGEGYGVLVSNSTRNHPGCAKVFIDKNEINSGIPMTHIVSRGYNISCKDVNALANNTGTINPHIVERRSEVRYNSKGGVVIGGGNSSVNIFSSATNISPFSPYTITWSSSNVDSGSCQEKVSPDDGDTWPQNSENGSNQISSNPGDGTYTYTIDCISSVDHVTHKIASVAVKISSGGGGFNTPSLDIRARPKIGVPTSGSITLPAGQIDAEISWYPAFVTNCQRDVPPYATANAIWLSGPTNSTGNFFGQVFPSGYPVGDFTDRTFGIKCTADNTTGPLAGTILRAQVTVRY